MLWKDKMQKESSLIKRLKSAGKTGLAILGIYAAFALAETGLESYYIMRGSISSSQSYRALHRMLSHTKNFSDIEKTLFPGFFLAHAINVASNFGDNDYF